MEIDNHPKWAIKQLLEEVKYNHHGTSNEVSQINEKPYLLLLPYYGPKVEKFIRSIKNALKSKPLDNIVNKSAYIAMRLKDKFNIQTKTILLLLLLFIS